MQLFRDKTVLITGASSGIGAALAAAFAAQGAHLILLARRIELLETQAQTLRVHGTQVAVYACDVTHPDQLEAIVQQLHQQAVAVDVVIANAGFGVVGQFADLSLADYQRQFDTNVWGVMRTIRATLPLLRHSRGTLAIMGSVVGHVAQPGGSAYAMSKFAVRALADALRAELVAEGVSVTLLSPGVVDSNLRRIDNHGVFHPQATDPFPRWLRMPTDVAARKMLRAIHRRKPEQIITLHGKLIVWLSRYVPTLLRYLLRTSFRARPQVGQAGK